MPQLQMQNNRSDNNGLKHYFRKNKFKKPQSKKAK